MKSLYEVTQMPIVLMSDEAIEAERLANLARAKKEASDIVRRVNAYLRSNIATPEQVCDKFNLTTNITECCISGLVKIAYYTDESERFLCFEITDDYESFYKRTH